MATIEELKKRIQSTEDLQSVVKTMKSLAAVNIRQYEKAVESLRQYSETVDRGFQVVLGKRPGSRVFARSARGKQIGALIFGSDQGMCGSLNEQVVTLALEEMEKLGADARKRAVLALGKRASALLEDRGQRIEGSFGVPTSVSGITPMVQELLVEIETWSEERGIDQVFLFYSKQLSGASYRPHSVRLLPVDQQWLSNLEKKQWPTRALPSFTMDVDMLFSALIREYLFISLFRAFAESLASENASRLAAMQGAETNIEERLADLNRQFHQRRQMSITEELLDIVAGFEALK